MYIRLCQVLAERLGAAVKLCETQPLHSLKQRHAGKRSLLRVYAEL